MNVNRRAVIKGTLAAGVATQVLKVPAAPAQAAPLRVGFLTIKTGPLASGGLQMEQGLTVFFKERNNTLAGRPVELHTADTAGNPAQARTKTQELVERLNVAALIGPLAQVATGREHVLVQSLTLISLRALGVADARARGLVVQTAVQPDAAP